MTGKSRFSDGLWKFSIACSSGTTTFSPTFTGILAVATHTSPLADFTRR